jgi:hypothetical protein
MASVQEEAPFISGRASCPVRYPFFIDERQDS